MSRREDVILQALVDFRFKAKCSYESGYALMPSDAVRLANTLAALLLEDDDRPTSTPDDAL